jgi:hypothetical protein
MWPNPDTIADSQVQPPVVVYMTLLHFSPAKLLVIGRYSAISSATATKVATENPVPPLAM